jgi:hypothetical protein
MADGCLAAPEEIGNLGNRRSRLDDCCQLVAVDRAARRMLRTSVRDEPVLCKPVRDRTWMASYLTPDLLERKPARDPQS